MDESVPKLITDFAEYKCLLMHLISNLQLKNALNILLTSTTLLLAVHVFCMDCAPFVAMACRLLLCTLCSSLLQWPRLHMLFQPGGDSLTPRIEIALRPLPAEQLGMATAYTPHQLSPPCVTKPIWHYLIT